MVNKVWLLVLALLCSAWIKAQQGVTLEDLEGLRGIYSQKEILQRVEQQGLGFAATKENLKRVGDLGYSGSFLLRLQELVALPKFPPLPEYLTRDYKPREDARSKNTWALVAWRFFFVSKVK